MMPWICSRRPGGTLSWYCELMCWTNSPTVCSPSTAMKTTSCHGLHRDHSRRLRRKRVVDDQLLFHSIPRRGTREEPIVHSNHPHAYLVIVPPAALRTGDRC